MAPASPTPSLGEVARRLDDVFDRFEHLANEFPKTFVSKELFESYKEINRLQSEAALIKLEAQEKRVAELEDDKKWLYRLIVGAVILALIGLIFSVSHGVTKSPGLPAKAMGVSVSERTTTFQSG